jgi:peptidyl-prolyl cis-trans isomerase A (cyclophilin A)
MARVWAVSAGVLLSLSLLATVAFGAAAPAAFTVTFHTDIKGHGPMVALINRSWAPLGVDHFYELCQAKFYDEAALFRYVPQFVLQFGISGIPAVNNNWTTPINDDPFVGNSNVAGTLVYATAGPNTRTTQLFINFVDNSFLDSEGFVPIGRLTRGLDTAIAAFNPTPGNPNGVDQNNYTTMGNKWIRKQYPDINFILTTSLS